MKNNILLGKLVTIDCSDLAQKIVSIIHHKEKSIDLKKVRRFIDNYIDALETERDVIVDKINALKELL